MKIIIGLFVLLVSVNCFSQQQPQANLIYQKFLVGHIDTTKFRLSNENCLGQSPHKSSYLVLGEGDWYWDIKEKDFRYNSCGYIISLPEEFKTYRNEIIAYIDRWLERNKNK